MGVEVVNVYKFEGIDLCFALYIYRRGGAALGSSAGVMIAKQSKMDELINVKQLDNNQHTKIKKYIRNGTTGQEFKVGFGRNGQTIEVNFANIRIKFSAADYTRFTIQHVV